MLRTLRLLTPDVRWSVLRSARVQFVYTRYHKRLWARSGQGTQCGLTYSSVRDLLVSN